MIAWLQFFGGVVVGCVTMWFAVRFGMVRAVRPLQQRVESLERIVLGQTRALAVLTRHRHSLDGDGPLGAYVAQVALGVEEAIASLDDEPGDRL